MRPTLTFLLSLLFIQVYGQSENRLQPDSIYKNRKVKVIYAYMNSKKDLSEVIEFNREGYKVRSTKYSASYNEKTRKRKSIQMISGFKYDSQMKLTQIIDSVFYFDNSYSINNTYFHYNSNENLAVKKYYQREFETPTSETYYQYNPYQSTTIRRNDSLVTYYMVTEYDIDFYAKKSYGFNVESKLKNGFTTNGKDTLRFQYSDYSDMQRFGDTSLIANTFNSKGQLTTSVVNQIFMTNRTFACKLSYSYYSNGLLKSIRGYVPEFFRYEFYD